MSASLISQVERGLAKPSVNTLYAMARELDISLDELLFVDARGRTTAADDGRRAWAASGGTADLGPRPPRDPVQRADDRKTIRLASGVTWERLTTESSRTSTSSS